MKGIETLPIQLIASMILIAVLVSVGWMEITGFLSFKAEKDFKESMVNLYQQMYNLKVLSDEGAFGSAVVIIPPDYKLEVDKSADELIGRKIATGEEVYRIKLNNIDIIAVEGSDGEYFNPGIYDIRIVYSSQAQSLRNSITFR